MDSRNDEGGGATPPDGRPTSRATGDLAAEWVAIDQVIPWADNPRINDGAPVDTTAASIKRFGFGAPLVVRKANGEIIAGHTRLKAAQQLGLSQIPVRYLDISEEDAHLLALADNPKDNANYAVWDEPRLVDLVGASPLPDLQLVGWDAKQLLKMSEADPANNGSSAPQLEGLEYKVIVECSDEGQQAELLERFESEGLKCRPLIS